jgi:hypothetical protein
MINRIRLLLLKWFDELFDVSNQIKCYQIKILI